MADSFEALERNIRRSHQSLEANLAELQSRAETAANWQAHYRAHVGVAVGAALVGGVILGALSRGQRGSSLRTGPVGQGATLVVDALLATAMTAAVEFVSELIPGFGDEYQARSVSSR